MTFFKQMTEKRRNIYLLTVELILITALTAGLFLGISAVRRDAYLTTIDWPESDFLPELSAAAPVLDCLSTDGMTHNQQILAASLQSVVNKTKPRLFLSEGPLEENQAAKILDLKFSARQTDLDAILDAYEKEIKGVVVWDTAQPDTAHLAAVIAAARRCVVADGPQAEALVKSYGLPVVEDLRDRFADRLDIYRTMLTEYGDKAAQRLLIGADPAGTPQLWDYAAAVGSLRVWLNPAVPAEAALLQEFLGRMPEGKSVYMGVWPEETAGIELASQYGVASLSGSANLSIYAASRHRERPEEGAEDEKAGTLPVKAPENRLYIALVAGNGELEEGLLRLPELWIAFRESDLPMSWSLSPALPHAAPALWNFYADTVSDADCFVNPTTGFGASLPTLWRDGESLLQFYKRMDNYAVEVPYAAFTLPSDWDVGLSPQGAEGLLSLYDDNLPRLRGLLDPVSSLGVQSAERSKELIRLPLAAAQSTGELESLCRQALDGYDGKSPAFLTVSTPLLQPADYEALVSGLAAENRPVEFVTVEDCLTLFRGQTEAASSDQREPVARRPLTVDWAPYDLSGVDERPPGPSPLRYAGAAALSLLLIAVALIQFHLLEKSRKRRERHRAAQPPAS